MYHGIYMVIQGADVLLNIFVETVVHLFQDFVRKLKRTALI